VGWWRCQPTSCRERPGTASAPRRLTLANESWVNGPVLLRQPSRRRDRTRWTRSSRSSWYYCATAIPQHQPAVRTPCADAVLWNQLRGRHEHAILHNALFPFFTKGRATGPCLSFDNPSTLLTRAIWCSHHSTRNPQTGKYCPGDVGIPADPAIPMMATAPTPLRERCPMSDSQRGRQPW